MKKFILGFIIGVLLAIPIFVLSADNLAEKLKGRILLAVEDKGKTYYVHKDGNRYRITKDTAQTVFENLALGITNENLEKIPLKELEINITTEIILPDTEPKSTPAELENKEKIVSSPAPNQDWLDEQTELQKEYPIILSIKDNKGNINKSSTFNNHYDNHKGRNTNTLLKAGDIITLTITVQEPKNRPLFYTWNANIECEEKVNLLWKIPDFNIYSNETLTCIITEEDIKKSKEQGNLIVIEGYIKSEKKMYRNPDNFDDSIRLHYTTKEEHNPLWWE